MAPPSALVRCVSLASAAALLLATPVSAAPPPVSPATAQANRTPVQQRSQVQIAAGDALSAAMELDAAAAGSGDPVLYLDAADAYFAAADASRDTSALDVGRERVKVALDILYFLRDPASSDSWRPVSSSELGGLTSRANEYLQRAAELQTAIESESDLVSAPTEVDEPRPARPGRVLIISGAALTGLGAAGLVMGATGLIVGGNAQREADDPTVYGDAIDDVDARGKTANTLAWGGLIGGGVLAGAGVALMVLGLKKKKSAGGDAMARVQVSPTLGGLLVRGRF